MQTRLIALVEASVVVASEQPVAGLLYAVAATRQVVVVSANLRMRPYELALLSASLVAAMLDIVTGEVWTRPVAEREFGIPVTLLPDLEAILGAEPGKKPLVRVPHLERHRDALAQALAAGLPLEQASVPPSIRQAIVAEVRRLQTLAHAMRGHGVADANAQAAVAKVLRCPAISLTSAFPRTAYVMADVDRSVDPMLLREVVVLAPGVSQRVRGHAEALSLLRSLHELEPHRWFVPHALDVLGCLADHGAPMPSMALDPAHMLFVLDPDEPPPLDAICAAGLSLSPDLVDWLGDARREVDEPAGFLAHVGILPELHAELLVVVRRENLDALVEDDIAQTVPVLARIERRGAWVDVPPPHASWDQFGTAVQAEIERLEKAFLPFVGSIDPYASSPAEALKAFRSEVTLKLDEDIACADHSDDVLDRLTAIGFAPAIALRRARRLDKMGREWLKPLGSAPKRLRGQLAPTSTGRWSTSRHNLQGMNKSGPEGRSLRGALKAPPGYELVVADYNAFEGRILAGLSGDSLLLAAAQKRDFHEKMATSIFGRSDATTRAGWKSALYGISYGQSHDRFVRTHPEFSVADASDLYDTVVGALEGAIKFQRKKKRGFSARMTRRVTRGGWCRRAPLWTSGFNTLLQGLAADILRWCLRTLDRELAPLGAFVVHQAHDEVFVATPPEASPQVREVVRRVMEEDVLQTGLIPGVPLFVKIESRHSWAEGT
jgi:hypothetical protein